MAVAGCWFMTIDLLSIKRSAHAKTKLLTDELKGLLKKWRILEDLTNIRNGEKNEFLERFQAYF